MNEVLGILGVIGLLADLLFGAIFLRSYYLSGPVLGRLARSIPDAAPAPPTPDALQHALRSFFFGSLVFEDFGGQTYGFRTSLLHGSGFLHFVVVFDPDLSAFEVQGRLGWGALVFGLAAALIILSFDDAEGLLLLLAVVATLTFIDFLQCRRAAATIGRLWRGSPGRQNAA